MTRSIFLLGCLISFSLLLARANVPQKKPKTDAMLFGGVKSNGEHIPFATVTIKGTTIGTAADATGHFKLVNLPLGKQIVIITAVGYKPYFKEVFFV